MRTTDRMRQLWRGSRCRLALELGMSAAVCAAIAGAAASCSLVVSTSSDQCAAASECASFPGLRSCENGVCAVTTKPPACAGNDDCKSYASAVCTSGVCVRSSCANDGDCGGEGVKCESGKCVPGGTIAGECKINNDCTGKGPYFVCRKEKCQSLVNDLCTTVYTTKKNDKDAYLDDTAFVFGSILPTVGIDAEYGTLVEDAIRLAIDDFAKVNGIPSATGGTNRPLVLVGCNDGENEDRTDEAANHLIDDLGIPAIIGYAFSGNTISVATGVTINKNTLLFSPSATSNDITMLNDKDLVWRTSPRDDFQAAALALYYKDVEAKVKASGVSTVKVAIIHNNDPYGSGLADVLQGQILINGKSAGDPSNANNYKRVDYGDTEAPNLGKVSDVVSFAPHVIFVFGFNEGPGTMLPEIEKAWTAPDRPQWIFSDGGQVGVLWNDSIKDEQLRVRVTGSVPGANTKYQPYNNFRLSWNASKYSTDSMGVARSPDTIGPAGAYDITYLFAYSAVAVGQNELTGPNMVKMGLRKMLPVMGMNLPKATIGPLGLSSTFPKLSSATAIDIEGASGPLDFDQFGEARSDIQIWCVPKGAAPAPAAPAIYSGRYFDSATSMMAGAVDAACALP